MAGDKPSSQQAENTDHEAVLTGVIALANLFSNCVEAFGLIHPGHKWDKEEQLLLCRLGIQQARLLIWGDVVGISSPPASVTDRAVPKHPSAAYPDLKEPTFFPTRDGRLDDTEMRQAIENALSAVVDRSSTGSREEMMEKYGLKPPKRFASEYQPALDTNRLEAFRERYELLKEVAESYAQINTRRTNSIVSTSWTIADFAKFGSFIKLTQEKVDFLINTLDIKENVDRGMRMDIKALGWHLSADRQRIALDVSKLRMISESCKDEYPEYLPATQQALENIDRERRENVVNYNPYASALGTPVNVPNIHPTARRGSTPFVHAPHNANGNTNGAGGGEKHKRPGLFGGLFKSFGKKSHHDVPPNRSQSVSAASTSKEEDDQPERSLSDVGPVRSGSDDSMQPLSPERSKSVGAILETPTDAIRSKSVGDILDAPTEDEKEEILQAKLEQMNTNATVDEPLGQSEAVSAAISRHDQYHGLARQGTKQNW